MCDTCLKLQVTMTNTVIFLHGGGSKEDYEADRKLADALKDHLGPAYAVQYQFLPDDGSPDMGRRQQINRQIAESEDGVFIVAHSFGASMLLACLSEFEVRRKIAGVFLIATPFWEGSKDWVKAFKLRPDFAQKLDQTIPLFFYHCLDDEEVPVIQMSIYQRLLPWAKFREIPIGGHQLNDDLSIVATDIHSITDR